MGRPDYELIDLLRNTGFSELEARNFVHIIYEMQGEQLATKSDLNELKLFVNSKVTEETSAIRIAMAKQETRTVIKVVLWVLAFLIAQGGVLFTKIAGYI